MLVEAPEPLLEVEGDVSFYEPPKIMSPGQIFWEIEVGLTCSGIDVFFNYMHWHPQNQR